MLFTPIQNTKSINKTVAEFEKEAIKFISKMGTNMLFEAAREGNLEILSNLLQQNPSILADARLASPAESLMHEAIKHGQSDFVHELMKLDPDLATDMNQYGLRPLDVASVMGKTAIVKTMLSFDRDLCGVAGRDSRTALHHAAVKGRVEIIGELLSTCPDCIHQITVHGETALHLAVEYCQFEAFNELINWLDRLGKASIINVGDGDGNTALHLAVSTKQFACLNLLIDEHSFLRGTIEINVRNSNGFTPLDVSDTVAEDLYTVKIRKKLQNAGATRSQDSTSISIQHTQQHELHHDHDRDHLQSEATNSRNWFQYFKFQMQRDSPSEARNTLLVVAALITTVTFQAAVNPPSGFLDESRLRPGQSAGISGFRTDLMFLFFNSIGFVTSGLTICYLTTGFPLFRELVTSLGCMFITYSAAVNISLEGSKVDANTQAIAWYVQIAALVLPHLMRRPPWLRSCWRRNS